eukprot:1990213-Ditylum_brightwellii.AAC.1
MEAHVHGLRSFQDHTSCGEAMGSVVVGDQGGEGVGMSHLLKRNLEGDCFAGVIKQGCQFCLQSGRYDMSDDC